MVEMHVGFNRMPEYLKLLRFVAWKHILDLDVDV